MLMFRTLRNCGSADLNHSRGCADCGAGADWLGTVSMLGHASERLLEERDVRYSYPASAASRRTAAVSASANLPADADDDDVDRASHHRRRAIFRDAATGLVAELRARPERLRQIPGLCGFLDRRLILFGYTWALIHHALGGIRHLIWDSGRGFGPNEREWLAAANLIGSIALTVILWI